MAELIEVIPERVIPAMRIYRWEFGTPIPGDADVLVFTCPCGAEKRISARGTWSLLCGNCDRTYMSRHGTDAVEMHEPASRKGRA